MKIYLEEICTIVGLQLGVRQVNGRHHLLQELGAESIDILNIVATLEEKYTITIEESALATIETVSELHELVQGLVPAGDTLA